nr:transposase [Geobacillus stearothermophilus]
MAYPKTELSPLGLRQEGKSFHFIFLPLYSPQLNPVERLWKWLKDAVIANVFHKDQMDIDRAIAGLWNTLINDQKRGFDAWGCSVIQRLTFKVHLYSYKSFSKLTIRGGCIVLCS